MTALPFCISPFRPQTNPHLLMSASYPPLSSYHPPELETTPLFVYRQTPLPFLLFTLLTDPLRLLMSAEKSKESYVVGLDLLK